MTIMEQIGQFLIAGLTIGSTYALAGTGVMIVHNVTGVLNMAQGEFLMLGGMVAVSLKSAGVPYPLAFIAAVGITGIVGLLVERLTIRPIMGRVAPFTLAIVTVGTSVVIRAAALLIWDWEPRRLPPIVGGDPYHFMGVLIQRQSLWVFATAALLLFGLVFLFGRTLLGKALSATSLDILASQLMGINPNMMSSIAFGLAAILGAFAGIIVAPITMVSYDSGLMMSLKGVVAAIVGNYTPKGVLLAGIALGIVEALSAGLVSSGYKDAIGLFFLIAFLAVKARAGKARLSPGGV